VNPKARESNAEGLLRVRVVVFPECARSRLPRRTLIRPPALNEQVNTFPRHSGTERYRT
jgi:hypothetical protein